MAEETKCYKNDEVNIFLRSCKTEIVQPITGNISGIIPKWLNGVLIRNGPGSLEVGEHTFQHLFDRSALLHRFSIKDGKVTYQCRFLQSDTYKRNKKANRIIVTEFGTRSVPDPCHTIFQRIAATFSQNDSLTDNANISVYPFGDELYAFTETPFIHRVNQETLEAEGKIDVRTNAAIVTHTSHPHVAEDGTVYNLAMTVKNTGLHHNIACFPAKSKNGDTKNYSMFERAHIVATIPSRSRLHPSYMHSFGITENCFIIIEHPFSLSVPSMIINRLANKPFGDALKWYGDNMTKFSIVSRKTGNLTHKFYSKAFCYFHIVNQYEFSNHIVLDVCSYKDASLINRMYTENLKNMQKSADPADLFNAQAIRFVLPLLTPKKGTSKKENLINIPNTKAEAYLLPNGNIFVKPEKLCNIGCETPRIHYENYSGKVYQFFYAASSNIDGTHQSGLIKVNTRNKTTLSWSERNCYPSEPIFVPKPFPQDEDDGVVLAAMLWGCDETSRVGLIVLDAKTFAEIGRADFQTPSPVPKCLHGWFLPNSTA